MGDNVDLGYTAYLATYGDEPLPPPPKATPAKASKPTEGGAPAGSEGNGGNDAPPPLAG
jgi:hypothetical protein